MTYGTRSLLRPIQSFGRLTSYFGSKYSVISIQNILRSRTPIFPSDAPTKVLVLSLFASDQSAAPSTKMAAARKEFIIQPSIIKDILAFWKLVDNKVMAHIELDVAELETLPKNDVSRVIYLEADI